VTETDVDEEREIKELFKSVAGIDLEVDAYELRTILDAKFKTGLWAYYNTNRTHTHTYKHTLTHTHTLFTVYVYCLENKQCLTDLSAVKILAQIQKLYNI